MNLLLNKAEEIMEKKTKVCMIFGIKNNEK